jgi:hypothetical protein
VASPFFNDAIAGTVVDLPSTSGRIYFLKLINTTAAVAYLQIFRSKAAGVTLGTTKPDWTIRLGANEVNSIPMSENPAEMGGPALPSAVAGQASGLSMAGTTTATGSTGAAISVSALVT